MKPNSPHTLLCESCGYLLEGLIESPGEFADGNAAQNLAPPGNCPECGRPIATSLPTHRTGTDWQKFYHHANFQKRYGITAWLRTAWSMRHPKRTFDQLRIENKSSRWLLAINLLIAGAILIDPLVGALVGDPSRGGHARDVIAQLAITGVVWIALACIGAGLLFSLTALEVFGIRFISRQRGWRLTPQAAWQIVSHASYGWILFATLPMLAMALLYSVLVLFNVAPNGTFSIAPIYPDPISWPVVIQGGLVVGGLVLGLFIFESLVYIGVRRCKFATALPDSQPIPPQPAIVDALAASK